MDLTTARRQLAQYVTDRLSLEPDREIFAGDLPLLVPQGIGVVFTTALAAGNDGARLCQAELRGKFNCEALMLERLEMLCAGMPVYGAAGFLSLTQDGAVQLGTVREAGRLKYTFNLRLQAAFL